MRWPRRGTHPLLGLLLLAVCIAALFFVVQLRRGALTRGSVGVAELLPPNPRGVTVFIDVALLRSAGYLQDFATKIEADPIYREFAAGTGFDYARDVDSMAASKYPDGHVDAFLTARLHWDRFRQFANSHGGWSEGDTCAFPGSEPHRWVLMTHVASGLLGVRIATGEPTAKTRGQSAEKIAGAVLPQAPVWMRFGADALRASNDLPVPLNVLAAVLRPASDATVLLRPAAAGAAFDLDLRAQFAAPAQADAARTQLQSATTLLKLGLAREQLPDSAGVAAFLASGSFRSVGSELDATWPVQRALLDAIR